MLVCACTRARTFAAVCPNVVVVTRDIAVVVLCMWFALSTLVFVLVRYDCIGKKIHSPHQLPAVHRAGSAIRLAKCCPPHHHHYQQSGQFRTYFTGCFEHLKREKEREREREQSGESERPGKRRRL